MAKLDLKIPNLTLPDGNSIPQIAFGSGTVYFKKNEDSETQATIDAIKIAIKTGYRHLDNAEVYNTEREVGKAIKQSGVPREELYVTTKVYQNIDGGIGIRAAIDESLKKLQLDYVDLYLIHVPFFAKGDKKKLQDAWAQMEEVVAVGKSKSIGVSNFVKSDLDAILETAQIRPAINQIEFHPYLQHGDLLPYMKNKDIRVAAYAPLTPVTKAQGGPLNPLLASLAKKYAVNPGEVLLRWCVDQGIVPITTSTKEQRMSDMLRTFAFQLNPKEIQDITETGQQYHFRAFFKEKYDPDDRS